MSQSENPPEIVEEVAEESESDFPLQALKECERQVLNRNKWVVPVLPGGELEILMKAAIKLAKEGRDEENELCRRFYKDAMTTSYWKILFDEASVNWKPEIHVSLKCTMSRYFYPILCLGGNL